MDEIEEEAYRVLNEAKGQTVHLLGLPVDFVRPEDDGATDPVAGVCTRCGAPIQSTILKEKILEIARLIKAPAEIRCRRCMMSLYVDSMGRDN